MSGLKHVLPRTLYSRQNFLVIYTEVSSKISFWQREIPRDSKIENDPILQYWVIFDL
jgi:hypothetical protein